MLAFVNGMQRLTEGTGQPGNVLVLADGATDEAFSNLQRRRPGRDREPRREDPPRREHGRPLASRETYLVVNQPIPNAAPGRPKRRFLQVRGIDDPRADRPRPRPGTAARRQLVLRGRRARAARHGRHAGRSARPIQAVLGEGVARELGRDRTPEQLAAARNPKRLDVGDTFALGDRTWIVVGILKSAGSTFNSEIWAKRSLDRPAVRQGDLHHAGPPHQGRRDRRSSSRTSSTQDVRRKANGASPPRSETEYYASLSETNQQFLWAIGFVTVVMSVGGVFGVMNTMFAAISQRIKDIGVLRLLGYARWQILVSFLLESLVIALVGGLLGLRAGLAGRRLDRHQHRRRPQRRRQVRRPADWPSTPTSSPRHAADAAMGLLGGLLPALSAMRLRPLEALR